MVVEVAVDEVANGEAAAAAAAAAAAVLATRKTRSRRQMVMPVMRLR